MQDNFRGQFIKGQFISYSDETEFSSLNPAIDGQVVTVAGESMSAVNDAVTCARAAAAGWRRAGLDARISALRAVQEMVPAHVDSIADAITAEMGKTRAEALVEARSIAGKIDGVIKQLNSELYGKKEDGKEN